MITIDMLPDEVLLAIFDFCAYGVLRPKMQVEAWQQAWQSLVHVCRRWRSVVFGSPRRLNLRLVCTAKTPVRDMLDVWPPLPLLIRDWNSLPRGLDNIIAALEHRNRVYQIDIRGVQNWLLEKVWEAMQEPFPELTRLLLWSYEQRVTVIQNVPDSFLGGSAPRLEFLWLSGIPFPGLPTLLLSATHLVELHLCSIPYAGYISPEAMGALLSTLTSLRSLSLEFKYPGSLPDRGSLRPPPPTRSVLPALIYFGFQGVSEYLDDFVARINTPRLSSLYMTFFNLIEFGIPQLLQFISRTPALKSLEKARVAFDAGTAKVKLSSQTSGGEVDVEIECRGPDEEFSSLEQVMACTSCLPPLSTLEDLYIYENPDVYIYQAPDWQPDWRDSTGDELWLELLHPFTAVKNLYLSKEFVPVIAPALQELVGGRTTEVLPTLQNIFLEGLRRSRPVEEGIVEFVAARQVTNNPITVSRWDRDPNQDRDLSNRWIFDPLRLLSE